MYLGELFWELETIYLKYPAHNVVHNAPSIKTQLLILLAFCWDQIAEAQASLRGSQDLGHSCFIPIANPIHKHKFYRLGASASLHLCSFCQLFF